MSVENTKSSKRRRRAAKVSLKWKITQLGAARFGHGCGHTEHRLLLTEGALANSKSDPRPFATNLAMRPLQSRRASSTGRAGAKYGRLEGVAYVFIQMAKEKLSSSSNTCSADLKNTLRSLKNEPKAPRRRTSGQARLQTAAVLEWHSARLLRTSDDIFNGCSKPAPHNLVTAPLSQCGDVYVFVAGSVIKPSSNCAAPTQSRHSTANPRCTDDNGEFASQSSECGQV